jgi:hypothetical protein
VLFEAFGTWAAVLYGSAVLALISAGMAAYLKARALPGATQVAPSVTGS